MFVLDTNIVSELRKVRLVRANVQVARWADTEDAVTLYISAITVLELELGILLLEYRDAKHGTSLRNWLDNHVIPEFVDRILPVDTVVARRSARLHVPDPRSEAGRSDCRHGSCARNDDRHPQRKRFCGCRCEGARSVGSLTLRSHGGLPGVER
jgi:predicted nucleic acid-binding protein